MDTELEKIQALEKQIFEIIASADNERLSPGNLFSDIDSAYFELLDSSDDVSYRYMYLRFLLRYMSEHSRNTFLYIEQMILDIWRDTYSNGDFPVEIEETLFTVINKGYIENHAEIIRLADTLVENEQHAKAVKIYQLMEDKLDTETAWNNWSKCLARDENYQACVDILAKGLQRLPDALLLGCNRGYYLYRLYSHSVALEQLQQVIDRGEAHKYSSYNNYTYALNLKAHIYRELNMPLQAFFEYSRLSAAGDSKQEEVVASGLEMLKFVENL